MNQGMVYSKAGMALTERFEGCRLDAYQDVRGVWTIGFGHTAGVVSGMTCTQAQADEWLKTDTEWAVHTVQSEVDVALKQEEFDALVDFVFNLGSGNFSHSTLLKDLHKGDMEAAAGEFQKWDLAGGKVVAGLLRRRMAEAAEFKGEGNGA